MNAKEAVAEFWRRMNLNDWALAAELFAPDCTVDWPQSGERIRGAADFAALNAAYPATAPWRFQVQKLIAEDDRAVSETEVASADVRATVVSFFALSPAGISNIREFWPDPYPAPGWRDQWVEKL